MFLNRFVLGQRMEYEKLSGELTSLGSRAEEQIRSLQNSRVTERHLLEERVRADLDYFAGLMPYIASEVNKAQELGVPYNVGWNQAQTNKGTTRNITYRLYYFTRDIFSTKIKDLPIPMREIADIVGRRQRLKIEPLVGKLEKVLLLAGGYVCSSVAFFETSFFGRKKTHWAIPGYMHTDCGNFMRCEYLTQEEICQRMVEASIAKNENQRFDGFLEEFKSVTPSIAGALVNATKEMYKEVSRRNQEKQKLIEKCSLNLPRGLEELGEELQGLARAHEEAEG